MKFGGGCIMGWIGFSSHSTGGIQIIEGKIKGAMNREILEEPNDIHNDDEDKTRVCLPRLQ
jgi:hypothetical protein